MKFKLGKKALICVCVVCALVLAFAVIFPIIYCVALKVDLKASVAQVDESQSLKVTWNASKPIDKLTVSVYHDGKLINEETSTQIAELVSGEKEVDGMYGRLEVKVTVKKGIYTASKLLKVNASASEYNIAPITATMPVTMFSLSLADITRNGEIPTFVWFKRSGAWDWGNLPENVYPMPAAKNAKEFLNSKEETMYAKTSEYVKELYEINKESKFHLFYNDYFAYGWLQATIANGIPESNYNVTLLSDGTASFAYFNQHFNNDNATTEYAKMAAQWEKLKSQVAKNGEYDKKSKFEIKAETLREYAYVMAKEESNVEWWLTRISGTLAPNNTTFYEQVAAETNKVKVKDLNTLLKAIQSAGDSAYLTEQGLKKLYNFSDNMFEKAQQEGKEVMVVLGTWGANGAEDEPYLDGYTKALMAYYGDKYVYYYKGHPKYPTNSIDGKLEKLDKMGLIDVDSTIPAELIFFFNPEAFCSGYASTTFVSLTDEKSCALYNAKKDSFGESYKGNMDVFISKATNGEFGGLVVGDNCFLLEFTDTSKADFAIYNASNNTLKYYKTAGESYNEVQI